MKLRVCKCGGSVPAPAELADALEKTLAAAKVDAADASHGGMCAAYGRLSSHVAIAVSQLRGVCFGCWYAVNREQLTKPLQGAKAQRIADSAKPHPAAALADAMTFNEPKDK